MNRCTEIGDTTVSLIPPGHYRTKDIILDIYDVCSTPSPRANLTKPASIRPPPIPAAATHRERIK